MFIRTTVGPSGIFGKGVFTTDPIPRGKILCSFTLGSSLITEQEFVKAIQTEQPAITRTGTRYAGRYFTWNAEEFRTAAPTSFFNHSFEPNCLCHCGIVIARRDLAAGEELTLDYRTLVDSTDIGIYNDATSGREIRGFTAKETALRTAKEFIAIIEAIPDWDG